MVKGTADFHENINQKDGPGQRENFRVFGEKPQKRAAEKADQGGTRRIQKHRDPQVLQVQPIGLIVLSGTCHPADDEGGGHPQGHTDGIHIEKDSGEVYFCGYSCRSQNRQDGSGYHLGGGIGERADPARKADMQDIADTFQRFQALFTEI